MKGIIKSVEIPSGNINPSFSEFFVGEECIFWHEDEVLKILYDHKPSRMNRELIMERPRVEFRKDGLVVLNGYVGKHLKENLIITLSID